MINEPVVELRTFVEASDSTAAAGPVSVSDTNGGLRSVNSYPQCLANSTSASSSGDDAL